MTMIRWEPFRDMMSLRNAMDSLFEDSFVRPSRFWPELGSGELPKVPGRWAYLTRA